MRIGSIITSCRQFGTTNRLGFKFKLTDEVVREFEEKQKSKGKIREPEMAEHTKTSSLIMGRVTANRYKNIIHCSVPKYRFNDFLLMYIRENDMVQVLDDNDIAKEGDWVLLRRDDTILDKNVKHIVEKVVYTHGKYIDPITYRRSFGLYYEDDWERLEKIKLEL